MATTRPEPARGRLDPLARHLFLIGFMGAGKSAVGRVLAHRFGAPFVDLDQQVEAAAGCSVREIFRHEGEEGFRRRESEALTQICAGPPAVVATGGGAPLGELNWRRMSRSGVTVWLNPTFSTLAARLDAEARGQRPLFGDERAAEELWRRRLPVYERAAVEVPVPPECSVEEVAAEVLRRVEGGQCDT